MLNHSYNKSNRFLSHYDTMFNLRNSLLFFLILLLTQCGVNRQLREAKTLGKCRYRIAAADSVYLAGIDVSNMKNFEDFNLANYPRLGLAYLRKDIPLDLVLKLDITNPTTKTAAVNQVEYKILLAGDTPEGSELFSGLLNQRIEVQPGQSPTRVPIHLSTNIYRIISDEKSRNNFLNLFQNLLGSSSSKPARLLIKLKPTLSVGNQQVDYPGYITVQQEITADMLSSRSH